MPESGLNEDFCLKNKGIWIMRKTCDHHKSTGTCMKKSNQAGKKKNVNP